MVLAMRLGDSFRSILFDDDFNVRDGVEFAVNLSYVPSYDLKLFLLETVTW